MYADYLNGVRMAWLPRADGQRERPASVMKTAHTRCCGERLSRQLCVVVCALSFLRWWAASHRGGMGEAYRGGHYLDGDDTKAIRNPNPERAFPWGDEAPNADGVFRCNHDGADDGFASLAPVGSFAEYSSPYGARDMAGNVNEWTLDWYTTPYHAGLDGYRVVRGGSWLDMPEGCDAVSGATLLPMKEGPTMGMRGLYAPPAR